ncbi:hypothetical protein CK203_057138 [Vitis vinifera]|uniref:Uncharacterized protein n=1 Tax=Vitis vinifera TaxID=29760 RepID=A0A438GDC0_VITVI|nr:hypothetical protein CK203_057138 [Vitis vinifera]
MKIINWNTRGLGSRNKRRVVKDFLRSENPDVVMIQETKKVKCNKRFVGSVWTVRNKDWATLPACGASSGILIIWDSKKLRSEVVIGSFSVSIKFDLVGCGPLWISAVYGPNSPSLRKEFWVELLDIFGLSFPLWCVGGDFNVIRRSSEKLGGSSLTSSMKDFDSFIRECELLDPPLRNASFTWSNMQESPVCKRLDHFLYSNEWGHLFPQGLQEVLLPRRTSDHWPIVLDTNPFKWGPTPFRFENMWLQHPSFKENFRNWWRGFQGNGWEGHKFMRRLQFVKANLKEWNKVSFGELNERKKNILNGLANLDAIEQSASRLDSSFTEEEISKAIFQLDRDKAPGPDGFTIAIFQDCWDVVKEDLVRVFVEFHRSGIIIKTLMPLHSSASKRVLHETIHSTQGAFVQGRQILDAVLIANEIVDEKRRSGEERVVFKIDFEKAYDHVSWDFLDHVLERGWVKASRGSRQGDPLSHFLFTLVADVLSRMLLRAKERNLLEGFRVNLDKSNIYGINLDQNHLSRLAELLDCKVSGIRKGKRDHLVSWDIVCNPKAKGGLGFGKISLRNLALLGKWLWRYPREGSTLWHQVILNIYGSHSNGWDANTLVRWLHRCPWKAIAQVFEEFFHVLLDLW